MSERIKEIVTRESVQTLEKLAFIFAMPEEEDMEPEAGETVDVSIDFSGPFAGSLLLFYPRSDLDELAANMLGLDDEDEITVDQKRDALKETANIICGNILPAIGGTTAVFDIKAPEVIDDPAHRPDTADAVKVQLELDEGIGFIYIMFTGGIPGVDSE